MACSPVKAAPHVGQLEIFSETEAEQTGQVVIGPLVYRLTGNLQMVLAKDLTEIAYRANPVAPYHLRPYFGGSSSRTFFTDHTRPLMGLLRESTGRIPSSIFSGFELLPRNRLSERVISRRTGCKDRGSVLPGPMASTPIEPRLTSFLSSPIAETRSLKGTFPGARTPSITTRSFDSCHCGGSESTKRGCSSGVWAAAKKLAPRNSKKTITLNTLLTSFFNSGDRKVHVPGRYRDNPAYVFFGTPLDESQFGCSCRESFESLSRHV